ncbi:hypothetical protein [uncultured Enterovirga sp.]|uniref:hypothetical protein n=1 Tax=uncultured Enterovirga sp. TaxID=2026352 RepID=UPI0035CC9326
MAEKLMADDAKDIVEAVTKAAKGGDMVAARLVLERIYPVRRGAPITFTLPPIATAADVDGAMSAITVAMAAGEMSPDEASTVAGVIEIRRKAIETSDLERRLQAIEAKLPKGNDR